MSLKEAALATQPLSTLVVPFPGESPPLQDAVRDAIRRHGRYEPIEDPPSDHGVRWVDAWQDRYGQAYIVAGLPWIPERMIPPCPDPACACHQGGMGPFAGFAVSVTTLLSGSRPLVAWRRQLRLARDLADRPANVYDEAAQKLIPADLVQEMLEDDDLPLAAAFTIHAVSGAPGDEYLWLHTHGLQRFDVPDLEMFAWPLPEAADGAAAISAVAECAVLGLLPPLGRRFDLGPGASLAWLPVANVVDRLAPGIRGRRKDRGPSEDVRGRRAALVAADAPAHTPAAPPLDAIRRWEAMGPGGIGPTPTDGSVAVEPGA